MSSIRSIQRLAIVNRGEAAMRCIRAVKSLRTLEHTQMEVIALYTEGDSDTPFVRHADHAIDITNSKGAVAAYLDHDALIHVLRECGADAVWPGWGFVAEDPKFVERLEEEGIAFLGPPPEAMKALGDKITSKVLAEKAGVPVTAWSEGALESVDSARQHAETIGYPVIIKATAGGGGRGIRVVRSPDEIEDAFVSAESEAASAFGNGTLFCEKLVTGGRHIEVQIAADEHGNVLALGCRDCSVQRRHQKVLEEAPPPWLESRIIETLKASAAQMARFVGYRGLGTVEFLLQGEDFFFLEVNPRLQVEHGITEEITGLDLVQLQIKIARGESIGGLEFEESGVALEARVCAEDPDENFLPSPGRIARFDPALGPRIRIDSGVTEGTTVSPDFDSLIAKVIATGSNRAEAVARLDYALRDFELVVDGGANNKGYILELLQTEDYNTGPVDTTWLDRWNEERSGSRKGSESEEQDAFVAAAIVAYQQSRRAARDSFYSDTGALAQDRIPLSQGQQIDLNYEGESYRLLVYAIGSWGYRVHLDGRAVRATMREEGAHRCRLMIDGRVRRMVYDSSELGLWLEVDGQPYRYGLQTAGQVRSGSPGMVVAIQVAEGDRVRAGQPLGLLEAMKMEIGFQAPVSGTVSEVVVRAGQQVSAGEVLLVIDPATDEAEVLPVKARVTLPPQRDPLALLFAVGEDGELQQPDLEAANEADLHERRAAMDSVREEIRRVILGFDTNPDRGAHLADFLEAPLTDSLSETFLYEMAEIRHEITTFVDIDKLFIRAPRASISKELGPSNDARLRMYVRRIRAAGAGIAEEFLDLVSCALGHYGVPSLEPSDALERAVLRLLSAQRDPSLRYRLLVGVVRRVTALAATGLDLGQDEKLDSALADVARLRPQIGNSLADAAIEANYMIFLRPGIEARAARTSRNVETWLASSETQVTAPPVEVLLEVAAAPRSVFDRVGQWISGDDPMRSEIALAAHTQRRYAPRIPQGIRTRVLSGFHVYGVDYPGLGLVLAVRASATHVLSATDAMFEAVDEVKASEPGLRLHAMEVVVPPKEEMDFEALRNEIESRLRGRLGEAHFTLGLLGEEGGIDHVFKTWEDVGGDPVLCPLYDLHPETAGRIGLSRYESFDLERIPAEEGIYPFYGRAKDVPGDERVFVLGDMRDRAPAAGQDFTLHLPSFERTFQRAARSLRAVIQERDPRRRLQWNRISIFVAPSIYFDTASIEGIAGRLAPATRNLGLEKVLVRLNLLDRNHPSSESVPHEIEILDTRDQMQIGLRSPHQAPLQPAREYERKLLITRRNRQPYAYETIKMLTQQELNLVGISEEGETQPLPQGRFEEYDLDATRNPKVAIPVDGRPYGENISGIVFGVISTPTDKVPEGMRRVLVLSDASMDMGALAAPECDRLVAAFDMAERLSLPLEWVSISSGARIAMDSGTENLDSTARVVRRIVTFTQAGGTVNLIVAGVNIGAQAYFDALATMLMHTRGVLIMTQDASMLLTGRRALEAAGSVSAEDEAAIGGYERIMGPNGEAQYQARNLAEAYRILYEHYRFDYVEPGESSPRRLESGDPPDRSICDFEIVDDEFGFATVGEIFSDETNPGRKRPFAMRSVMHSVVDQDGGHLERWQDMVGGETTIVWDAHLGGVPVELIGIESHSAARDGYRPHDGPPDWSGGTLFPRSSKKMARAINAASGIRPVVILANLSGFDGSPESLRKLQLEYGAEIARAVVNFDGPILFTVVSRYHGGAYVVFSQELNPKLEATALSGSYASVIGGGPAASVVFAREVRAQAAADSRVLAKQAELRRNPRPETREEMESLIEEVTLEKQAEVAGEFDRIHSVDRAREVGSLREIIDPVSLRGSLIEALRRALDES